MPSVVNLIRVVRLYESRKLLLPFLGHTLRITGILRNCLRPTGIPSPRALDESASTDCLEYIITVLLVQRTP